MGDYTFELISRLNKEGFISDVFVRRDYSSAPLIQVESKHSTIIPTLQWGDARNIPKIISELKKKKASWLFIQYVPNSLRRSGFPFYMILLIFLCKVRGIKVGIFFHEVSVRVFGYGMKSFVMGSLQRVIAYGMMMFSNVVATSNLLYRSYLLPFKVTVVPIPANIYVLSGTSIQSTRLSSVFVMLTFMNRCSLQILTAFKRVLQRGVVARLLIIGKGSTEWRNTITTHTHDLGITKSVDFFDKFSKDDIAQVMGNVDLFLHDEEVNDLGHGGVCSKSGVISAAMAASLPIISTYGDMTDEKLFIDQYNMMLLKRRTSLEYENVMMDLYQRADFRKMLGRNARNTYDKYFSWDHTSRFYLKAVSTC